MILVPKITRCDGGSGQKDCCGLKGYKCGEGEGDCDKDDDCKSGLVCGTDNCVGDSFGSTSDCCEGNIEI